MFDSNISMKFQFDIWLITILALTISNGKIRNSYSSVARVHNKLDNSTTVYIFFGVITARFLITANNLQKIQPFENRTDHDLFINQLINIFSPKRNAVSFR